MKLPVKCFEYLTNRGNGKKCKLETLIKSRHKECTFKKNGMLESSTPTEKIAYIHKLMYRCEEIHKKKGQNKHFTEIIKPQIETICSNIEFEE